MVGSRHAVALLVGRRAAAPVGLLLRPVPGAIADRPRSADVPDRWAAPGCLHDLVVGLVHAQDDEPGALGGAGQPVRLLVRSRGGGLDVQGHPAVSILGYAWGAVTDGVPVGRVGDQV